MKTETRTVSVGESAKHKIKIDIPENLGEYESRYGVSTEDAVTMANRELVRKVQSAVRAELEKENPGDINKLVAEYKVTIGASPTKGPKSEIIAMLKKMTPEQQAAMMERLRAAAEKLAAKK